MTDPIVLRVLRPYSSVDEFLDAEAHLIDARGMVLVGAAPVPEGTLIRFVVTLVNGEAIIKAEGRARGQELPSAHSPGGLRVTFKRFGASTKELVDRAVEHRRRALGDEEIDSSPRPTFVLGELSSPLASAPLGVEPKAQPGDPYADQSGVRFRQLDPATLEAPENRDELLERLRRRAQEMSTDLLRSLTKKTG